MAEWREKSKKDLRNQFNLQEEIKIPDAIKEPHNDFSIFENVSPIIVAKKRKVVDVTDNQRRPTQVKRHTRQYRRLYNERGDPFKFLLFNDTEVGLSTQLVQDNQIIAGMDDD